MALTWMFRCSFWGIVSSVIAAVLLGNTSFTSTESHFAVRLLTGASAILISVSSLIAFHISSLRCSESHTLRSLILCYITHERERYTTASTLAKIKHDCKYVREAQESLLRKLIARDAKTEYGRANGLSEIRSVEDLRKKHPLTLYGHFKKFIERLDEGKKGAFTGERPNRLCVTSGTTGVGKLIPYGTMLMEGDGTSRVIIRLATYLGSERPSPLQKRCFMYTHPKHKVSKSGLIIAPFDLITDMTSLAVADHTTPPPAFTITDEPVAAYVHMLFAIADPNLGQVTSVFTPAMYRAFRLLENNWSGMLNDLSTGTINDTLSLTPEMRRSIESYLVPDPGRVAKLRKEFEKGFDGIVKRIWPHLTALEAIDILGFRKKIQEKYGKGVPFANTNFASTEAGIVAVNMDIKLEEPSYVLLPTHAVFEFIPEELILEDQPKTLLLDEVQAGESYEFVVTTLTGLYRYRNGDVIRVAGFYENSPVICMRYRTGELLNVATEKTNAFVATMAVNMTLKSWPRYQLVNWTCTESALYDPGTPDLYYVLFVELDSVDGKRTELTLSEEQRSKFDESLQLCHDLYKNYRVSRTISMARVHVVRPGTFTALREYVVSHTTASINQYKTPRKLRTREHIEWIMERVVDAKKK